MDSLVKELLAPSVAEQYEAGLDNVRGILEYIGENPNRDGLIDTPARVLKSMKELTVGYSQDPAEILGRTFDNSDSEGSCKYNGIVILKKIELFSLCEHHVLPFVGQAHIAYIPGPSGRIVGLSKLARLVDCFSRRLQVQERLTAQIADAIEKHLAAEGAMVIIEAVHSCMRMRGVGKQNSVMITSEVRGIFRADDGARAEALRLLDLGNQVG